MSTVAASRPQRAETIDGDGDWDALVRRRATPDPCRSQAWLDAVTACGLVRGEVWTRVLRRDGGPVAAIALERRRRRGLAVVTDLGADGTWFDLTPPAEDDEALAALVAGLRQERGDLLVLNGIEPGSAYERAICAGLPEVRFEPATLAYRVDLRSPTRGLTKRRAEVRREMRRAEERGQAPVIATFRAWREIVPLVDEVLNFHRDHFRGSGANQLVGPRYEHFTRTVLAALGAREAVRLTTVRSGTGALAAFDLSLRAGRGAVGFASAFDRDGGAGGSSWIAVVATLDALAQEGVEQFDMGPGPEDSHKRMVAPGVERRRAIVPLGLRGRLALAARRMASGVSE